MHDALLDSGGIAPNVVQASAKVRYLIRVRNLPELTRLVERVIKIARRAARMTETEMESRVVSAVSNLLGNASLERAMHDNLARRGPPPFDEADRALAREFQTTLSDEDIDAAYRRCGIQRERDIPLCDAIVPLEAKGEGMGGSTDVGDVSWAVPTVQAPRSDLCDRNARPFRDDCLAGFCIERAWKPDLASQRSCMQKMLMPFLLRFSGLRFRPLLWLVPAVLAFLAIRPAGAEVPSAMPNHVLIVGTKEAPPFAMKERNGSWTGISIDLWRRIANELHLRYRFREVSVPELVDGTAAGRLDASIAAITITPDRERMVDFSEPYYTTSLGIAVPRGSVFNWLRLFGSLVSFSFVQALLGLIGVTLLIGSIVWALERHHTEYFGGDAKAGLATGVWWSALTLTQSAPEFGPKTLPGRFIAVTWMAASVISIAVLTAGVTSHLTREQLEGDVHGAADLQYVSVGAAAGAESMSFLSSQNIKFKVYRDFTSGLNAVKVEELDAFVHDRPILYWLAKNKYEDSIKVLDVTFDTQDYAIALPNNSSLRVPINRAMLAIIDSQEWRDSIKQYLGDD